MCFLSFLWLGLAQLDAFCRSGGSSGTGPGDAGSPEQAAGGAAWGIKPEGVAAAESLSKRLEASHGQSEAFIRGAAKDAVQHTLGLVKTHLPERIWTWWEIASPKIALMQNGTPTTPPS